MFDIKGGEFTRPIVERDSIFFQNRRTYQIVYIVNIGRIIQIKEGFSEIAVVHNYYYLNISVAMDRKLNPLF